MDQRIARPWWGRFSLEAGNSLQWEIGPTRLRLWRGENELRAMHWVEGDPMREDLSVAQPAVGEPPERTRFWRFGFDRAPSEISLLPAMADRAVIASPEQPFFLPPRESATIYLSTVLWLQLKAGDEDTALIDLPLFRPSDTWFGASTRSGEIAYASRTTARLRLQNVPVMNHRAIAAVRIENRANTVLEVERIRLPAVNLSIHAHPDGGLFTETSTLTREEDGDLAALKTERTPPSELGTMEYVSGPREVYQRGTRLRSFGLVLGKEF